MRADGHIRRQLASALLAALAVACGHEPVPAVLRLTEASATLHTRPPAPPVAVLEEDFDEVPVDWPVITSTQNVLSSKSDALIRTVGREGPRSYLTLAGRGATYTVVPVEGGTPYLFQGTLRARGIEPTAEAFHGVYFWVAETSKVGRTPGELFAGEKRFDRWHPVASAWDEEGWRERSLAFRTLPETRTLIVGCVLAVDEEISAGEADFDRLRVARIDAAELWEFGAAGAVATEHRGSPLPASGDWRARRRVGAMLGAEERPSALLLPGERLEFSLTVPESRPVLTCGLGPWPAGHLEAAEPLVHVVRVEGRTLLREEEPLAPLARTAWREATLDLAEFAGRRVRLELALEGPVPGVFGAPQLRARGLAPAGPNVLFVSIDTLRADRVGAYGATSGATPRLDALARAGIVAEDMIANAPYTLPSHATLFSGQMPTVHGVEDRGRVLAPLRSPVLAQLLAARGYRTQAFAAGGFVSPAFGLDVGFDGFSIADPLRHRGSAYFGELAREFPDQAVPSVLARPGIETIRAWMRAHADEPFFLFVHTYEVHDYDPPPGTVSCAERGCTSGLGDYHELLFPKVVEPFPGTPEDREHLGHLYDAALRHVDAQLGTMLDTLDELGLAERTLVVVTSDHGEELFERGHLQHGKTLYDEILRVPLVLHAPGQAPRRLAFPAMQVDVAPTLLRALGLPLDPRMQGVDLLRGTPAERPVWAEVHDHFVHKAALREGAWKLLHGPPDAEVRIPNEREWELYDLGSDAGEERDRAASETAALARLRAALEGYRTHLEGIAASLPLAEAGALDESTERLLEALGYGGGGGGD